eukprot:g664.t1
MGDDAAPDDNEPGAFTKCCFAILDCLAVFARCFMAIYQAIMRGPDHAIKRCLQRCVYPVKERCIRCCDWLSCMFNPYKKKVPYTHVPTFSYGAGTV